MNPVRLVMALLWPLLVANIALWAWYAHSPGMAGMWGVLLVWSAFLVRDE